MPESPLDASLQPGTGSTDLIVGAYYYRAVRPDFDLLLNGQFQAAVMHHLDQPGNDFPPGNSSTLTVGLRYARYPDWAPELQLNLLHKSPDQGALADIQNSAGNVAYLSPGVTARLGARVAGFVFLQLPVYSNLYGYQLFPALGGKCGGELCALSATSGHS